METQLPRAQSSPAPLLTGQKRNRGEKIIILKF